MTSKPLPGRRTRSQIKLSDDILKVSEHSPMKTARNAVRKSSEPPSDMNSLVESEDELLLSPNKGNTLQRSKRSVSPPPNDGYNSGVSGEGSGRKSKRMKWDLGGEGVRDPARARLTKAGHARTNSEPNVGPSQKAPSKRAGTTSSNKKPNSMSHIPASPIMRSPTGVPGKTRAQSVPLFPSFSSLPHLDLRNPPSSPTRARSPCSSDKYHGLKVYPSPPKPSTSGHQPLQVAAFSDDPKVRMEVDEECSVQPVVDSDTAVGGAGSGMVFTPEVSIQHPRSPSPPVPTFAPQVEPLIIPTTPMPSEPILAISMSPLTPLPATPLPTKFPPDEDGNRYSTSDGWEFNLEKGLDAGSPLKPIPQPAFGNAKNALIAPSATHTTPGSQTLQPSTSSFLPVPALTGVEKAKRASLKAALHKGPGPSSKGVNAFSFLMQNAAKQHASKSQDKVKGKGAATLPQASAAGGTNAKGKGKLGLENKKPSLKDRMRRKEKQEPAAPTKFVPVIFHEDEDEDEEQVESEEQELKAETTAMPELVIPELEGKPPPWEGVAQEKLGEPSPALPDESPALEVLPTQKPEDEPLPENEVMTESIPQPQLSSPSALPPEEPVGLTTVTQGSTPLTPVISEASVVQEQHDRAASSLIIAETTATDDAIQVKVEVSAVVGAPIGQTAGEPVLEPRTTDTSVRQLVGPSKPKPALRKRSRSNIPTSTRVTRSTLKPPVPPVAKPTPARRATRIVGPARRESIPVQSDGKFGISSETEAQQLSLGSPMQTSSPLQTPSRRYRTPGSSPAKISLAKTPSKPIFTEGSPSPMKIARAVSMFSRPSDVFAVDDVQVSLGGSSLSTLSNALEKLKMPAPSRPNTSLGFNHTTGEGDDDEGLPVSTLLTEPEQGGSNLQRNGSRRRSMSIGHGVPGGLGKNPTPTGSSSTFQAGSSTTKTRLIQKSMTSFSSRPDSSSTSTSNPRSAKNQLLGNNKTMLNSAGAKGNLRGLSGIAGLGSGGGKLFPVANKRLVQKVSKKTSLPMVEASPIKGGSGVGEVADDNIPVYDFIATSTASPSEKEGATSRDLGDVFMVPLAKGDDDEMQMVEGSSGGENKGKEKEKGEDKSRRADSSRRASLALSQLSQSLSAAPAYGIGDQRSMGPPATPRKIARSVSSSYPAPSSVTSSTTTIATVTATTSSASSSKSSIAPDKVPTPTGTRSSARQAAKAVANADSSSPAPSASLGGSGKKDSAEKKLKGAAAPANKAESLKILNNCVIFVDVRADDGEEAGSLFVEMLEGLGAKILSRVGQTCTHVIFKNGLMSTISRWRLLRDPKPSVVGIAWVVDCVEQRRHVEEALYLINLKEVNVAGTHKRRRSMLPKLISGGMAEPTATDVEGEEGEADVSMESTSSITLDDDLTPLERARRRRSMIFGPPA